MKVKREEDVIVRILAVLTERGFRITNARKEVVEALAAAPTPCTVRDLAQYVHADEVSIYRTIALLVELSIAEEVEGKGEAKRYTLSSGDHHHHIVCTECGYTAHVPCDEALKVRACHPSFRTITNHSVTYYGQCRMCT